MISKKHKQCEKLQALLEVYQVLDPDLDLDPHEYDPHEVNVRQALRDLEKGSPSLKTLVAIYNLVDAALSQALNRDPSLPWIVGAKKVSGGVGQIKRGAT